jgi:hypothetical protein
MPYVLAAVTGEIAGSLLAHGIFELPLAQVGVTARTGAGQWLGEITAASGLVQCRLLVHVRHQLREPSGNGCTCGLGHLAGRPLPPMVVRRGRVLLSGAGSLSAAP